jgi:outer membrane beta-barrel protein
MPPVSPTAGITLKLPRHTLATWAFLVLLAAPFTALAQAQEAPGLDLSQPPETQRPAEEAPRAPSAAERERARKKEAEAPLAPGERDVALGDRVKAVQRKGFMKAHRFEFGVAFPATVNDAFYEKLGVGGKIAYNFEDSFALALRGAYFTSLRTDHAREGKLAFSSQLLQSELNGQVMLDGIWSPVYGKIAWLGSSIVHFDLYLLAGFGGVWSATSSAPRKEGPHIATDFGGGIRFYPKSWLALDGGVIATLYPDQPVTQVPSTVQKVVAVQFGLTFFLPTTFEYVYP